MELDNETLNDLKLLKNSFKHYKKEHLIQNMTDEDLFFKYGDYFSELYAT